MTSLSEAKRQATIAVLTEAAKQALITHGADATVEEVASLAGVSRSTVFRHFASRDDLLGAAVVAGGDDLTRALPEYDGGDWREWLRQLCAVFHQRATETMRGASDLSRRRDLSPRLAASVRELERNRIARSRSIATTLWNACGGKGATPAIVANTVAAHLSPLFTVTVFTEVKSADSKTAAALAETSIAAVLERAAPRR